MKMLIFSGDHKSIYCLYIRSKGDRGLQKKLQTDGYVLYLPEKRLTFVNEALKEF